MVKAILTKPLDGNAEGETVEFNKTDFEMLEKLGAVTAAPDDGADDADSEEKDAKPPKRSAKSTDKAD